MGLAIRVEYLTGVRGHAGTGEVWARMLRVQAPEYGTSYTCLGQAGGKTREVRERACAARMVWFHCVSAVESCFHGVWGPWNGCIRLPVATAMDGMSC